MSSSVTPRTNIAGSRDSAHGPGIVRARYKRPFDLAVIALAGVALAPLWLLICVAIALAIRQEDGGRILYVQTRLGLAGRPFEMLKFRTMVEQAEIATGPIWAADNDTRVTRVGRILRPLHLDEIPQILNIVKGDMSLVGPRPERPKLAYRLSRELPEFGGRLCVRPGIAGLAQARQSYHATARQKYRYDSFYIAKMNPLLDLKLLAACVLVAIRKCPLPRWRRSGSAVSQTGPEPGPVAADQSDRGESDQAGFVPLARPGNERP